ncbi:MAG: hypothetical protein ACXAEU_18545 [Candidatus Hodarchaeales archaeon]
MAYQIYFLGYYIGKVITVEDINDQTTSEKSKRKQISKFIKTNRTFVLLTGKKKAKLSSRQKKKLVVLARTMPLDERIDFFMSNFESVFVNMFPDDVGYFAFAPGSKKGFELLERDLQRIYGA